MMIAKNLVKQSGLDKVKNKEQMDEWVKNNSDKLEEFTSGACKLFEDMGGTIDEDEEDEDEDEDE